MAGDWLKFEKTTLDKPEVFEIAGALDIDPDAVVGKLLRIWGWFDEQSLDGNAPVTVRTLLDRYAGVSGFTKEMESVGWLVVDGSTMSLPNFDRHNGQTAKTRALTASRVAKKRGKGNGECNGASVTPIVTQSLPEKRIEEKRIEEEKVVVVQPEISNNDDHVLDSEIAMNEGKYLEALSARISLPVENIKSIAKGKGATADQLEKWINSRGAANLSVVKGRAVIPLSAGNWNGDLDYFLSTWKSNDEKNGVKPPATKKQFAPNSDWGIICEIALGEPPPPVFDDLSKMDRDEYLDFERRTSPEERVRLITEFKQSK